MRRRPGGDTIGAVSATIVDPWQARLDRMRRILPLPLLTLSAVTGFALPDDQSPAWTRLYVGVPLVAVSFVWWTVVTVRFRGNPPPRLLPVVFAGHVALCAVLVWIDRSFGVFAYTGFLFAYGLGPRWRTAGFAATALVVSASLSGYPGRNAGQTFTYVVVAVVLLALVLNSATITGRAVEQNQERGRMIAELAEANRRLAASMAENADLQATVLAQAREAGVVEERQRLAGEIHDTLAQGLAGIVTQLEAAEHSSGQPGEWSRHLTQARTLARDSLTEARRSVRALRPEQLEAQSLPEALESLAGTWSAGSGVTAEVETTGTPVRTHADVEATLFRVAQEALTNVARHARAHAVRLTLTYLDDTLLLDVVDDGVGFDPVDRADGYGLAGMRHRLTRIGGALTVESAPGYGSTVNASVPLDVPRAEVAS
ncbi:sensor histidine kinase [Actinocatenispora rupis]|uniref:Histidine kinase n=1 Tax=Actinocatenispora rupis TaxID=519421 RepID=A0A8J3NHR7_9ACTN|nr:histidine kinase [Actinocatenispora rupis]